MQYKPRNKENSYSYRERKTVLHRAIVGPRRLWHVCHLSRGNAAPPYILHDPVQGYRNPHTPVTFSSLGYLHTLRLYQDSAPTVPMSRIIRETRASMKPPEYKKGRLIPETRKSMGCSYHTRINQGQYRESTIEGNVRPSTATSV